MSAAAHRQSRRAEPSPPACTNHDASDFDTKTGTKVLAAQTRPEHRNRRDRRPSAARRRVDDDGCVSTANSLGESRSRRTGCGAQTQRSLKYFLDRPRLLMPPEMISAYAIVKKACATPIARAGVDAERHRLIVQACDRNPRDSPTDSRCTSG